jgi:hypothetical protein
MLILNIIHFNAINVGLRETDIMDQMKTITGVYKLLEYN